MSKNSKKREMSMYSKITTNVEEQPRPNPKQVQPREASAGNGALEDRIRRRAYEIHLERGEQPGSELDDWFRAEHELKRST